MWQFFRPHLTTILVSLGAGIVEGNALGGKNHTLVWVPFVLASVMAIRQVLSVDLSPFSSARLYVEKLTLAFLAFGIGFAAFWAFS